MAETWRELRFQVVDIEVVSSWIDIPHIQKLDDQMNSKVLEGAWERNVQDVRKCDALLAYAAPEDVLVGALVEVGVALGAGKTVICVGSSRSFGTWVFHENVYKAKSVMDAVNLARGLLG
jgi:nucleoside 2-deoxyribosyltransferase